MTDTDNTDEFDEFGDEEELPPWPEDDAEEDAEDEEPSAVEEAISNAKTTADRAGSALAAATVWVFVTAATIPKAVLNHLPKGVAIGQALHRAGINVIRKNGDAQFVAYTIYGDGEIIPRPAGIDSETQWVETDNGEEWVAENGVDLCRVGDAPVAFGVADAHEMVSPIRARLAEKIDSGGEHWRCIREHDTGHVEDVNYGRIPQSVHAGRNGNGAVADGGQTPGAGPTVPSSQQQPQFDDIWVDLSNWVEDGDGMIVSMKKAYETTHQKGSSEALQDAETRGRIAERFGANETKWAIYLVLTALGFLCLGLFGPSLAATIGGSAGGGGGGLGGVSPLMIESLTTWV